MSLSSRVKNKIVDTINTTFASLGHANGMRMPKSDSNLEPLAWELYVAKHVLSLAEKRKDKAELEAAKAGLINDKEKNPKPAGTREIIYTGNVVSISVEVRNPSPRVNVTKVLEYLVAKKVDAKLLADAVEQATTYTKPAHVFTPILITNDAIGK